MSGNMVSVDVEDYFQVEAFSAVVPRDSWDRYSCRVEDNTRRVLQLLDDSGVSGTFFVLGWVAERYPKLVREIASRGHELACHSYWHRMIERLTPEEFREDTLRAKNAIEQCAGLAVKGYRAPTFSITPALAWALEILAETGFEYDSSVFPVKHDLYGVPSAPRRPFRVQTQSGSLLEFPLTTFRLFGNLNLPVGGGGYLRMLPSFYTKLGIRRAWRESLPAIVYLHPWEVDPDQPRIAAPWKSKLRHYTNLSLMSRRLTGLLAMGDFSTFENWRHANAGSALQQYCAKEVFLPVNDRSTGVALAAASGAER